jgi:tRNA(adenine34) deaminase
LNDNREGRLVPFLADLPLFPATAELFMSAKKKSKARSSKRWVASVTTDSTHPPEGLFAKDAATIARTLASKKVSPKGPGSGMRMLTYFINRGGRNLSASRRRELEKAKTLLSQRIQRKKKRAA